MDSSGPVTTPGAFEVRHSCLSVLVVLARPPKEDDAREVEASTGRPRADTTTAPDPALAAIYRILGRTSVDIIKSGGYKISGLEIESVLLQHDKIRECAVVGKPDETWGEKVTAVCVLQSGAVLTIKELREWGKERMASYKVPQELEIVTELPGPQMGVGSMLFGKIGANGTDSTDRQMETRDCLYCPHVALICIDYWCSSAKRQPQLQGVSRHPRILVVTMTMSMPNIGWNNQVDSAKARGGHVSVDHLHGEFMKVLDTVEEIKMEKVEAAEEAKRYARERRLREEELRLQAEQGARDSPEKQALLGLPEVAPGDGAAKVRPRKKKGQKKEDVFQDFGKEHDDAPIQEIKKNGLVFYHLNYKRYWQSDRDLERWAKSLGHNIRHEKLLFEVRNRWAEDLLGDRMELKIRHNPLVRSRTQERLRPTTGVSVALQLKDVAHCSWPLIALLGHVPQNLRDGPGSYFDGLLAKCA
ncbi:ACSF3 [Symbiodinium sp. CCMP2592]|nr:ACSF3 [Symbiodinium sp. CCMP2592]